jgi:amino acid permease
MRNSLPLVAALLGVVFLAVAVAYFLIPAGSLPAFLPGFETGSEHVHFRHALGSLVVALVLFAFAWFQRAREK